jgi:hypothetical protein
VRQAFLDNVSKPPETGVAADLGDGLGLAGRRFSGILTWIALSPLLS